MLKIYITTKLAIVSMDIHNSSDSQDNDMKSKFNAYLNSRADYISQQVDEAIKECVTQIRDAFKTLESSISQQLENNDKLSNENINEIYYLIQVFIKDCFLLNENNVKVKKQAENIIKLCKKLYYDDKINEITKDEIKKSLATFLNALKEIFENTEKKEKKKGEYFIKEFLNENNISDQELSESTNDLFLQLIDEKKDEINGQDCSEKFYEKCNIKFERKEENKGTKGDSNTYDKNTEVNKLKNDSENKNINNKFLIIGGTLFSITIITGIGYLAYDKLYKKTQRKICKNKRTPAVSAAAA